MGTHVEMNIQQTMLAIVAAILGHQDSGHQQDLLLRSVDQQLEERVLSAVDKGLEDSEALEVQILLLSGPTLRLLQPSANSLHSSLLQSLEEVSLPLHREELVMVVVVSLASQRQPVLRIKALSLGPRVPLLLPHPRPQIIARQVKSPCPPRTSTKTYGSIDPSSRRPSLGQPSTSPT